MTDCLLNERVETGKGIPDAVKTNSDTASLEFFADRFSYSLDDPNQQRERGQIIGAEIFKSSTRYSTLLYFKIGT